MSPKTTTTTDYQSSSNKNFNDKYFVLWFLIDSVQNWKKFDILWIKSWTRRYLVVGHLFPGGLGEHIGLQKGDRLGYLDGIIAPKLEHVEKAFGDGRKTLKLGILRKHSPQTSMVAEWILKRNKRKKLLQSCTPLHRCIADNDHQVNDPKELKHYFVSDPGYLNMKDPDIYDSMPSLLVLDAEPDCNQNVFHVREDQQSTPNIDHVKRSDFISNKENYQPKLINEMMSFAKVHKLNDEDPDLRAVLKNHELFNTNLKLYFSKYPEPVVKTKIDSHIKAKRALRNLENNQ